VLAVLHKQCRLNWLRAPRIFANFRTFSVKKCRSERRLCRHASAAWRRPDALTVLIEGQGTTENAEGLENVGEFENENAGVAVSVTNPSKTQTDLKQTNGQSDMSFVRLFVCSLCLSGASILRVDEARCFIKI